MLQQVQDTSSGRQQTVKSIMDRLVTEHGMTGVSYSTVCNYVVDRRSIRPRPLNAIGDAPPPALSPDPTNRSVAMSWSPAHHAVEHEDLPELRDLLDAGHDVEDDNGDGWTLLRHAIDVEHDGHVQTGEPLHADVTAFLLARGADPMRPCNGIPVVAEAEIRGHWLAAEIMHAWIKRTHPPRTA
jgi:uncharacterized protein